VVSFTLLLNPSTAPSGKYPFCAKSVENPFWMVA
jgi:hypothetical protein